MALQAGQEQFKLQVQITELDLIIMEQFIFLLLAHTKVCLLDDTGGDNPYVADAGGWVKILTENGSIADLTNVGSIASISNGQVLIWNSSAGRFDPASAGGDVSTAGSDLDQAR